MFGFAILSVLFNLIVGLFLLFSLILILRLLVHRSFKFPPLTVSTFLGCLWGTILATGILGTLWNWSQGANAKGIWYDHFIHMPIYGALVGGYLGQLTGEKTWTKAPRGLRIWLLLIVTLIALAAFYGYLYTGAISYGNN